MRDFLNEDELILLKETCISGQINFSKESFESSESSDIANRSFQAGLISVLEECLQFRNLSSIVQISKQAAIESEDIFGQEFIADEERTRQIAFLQGRICQSRFIFDRIIAFKYVKGTLSFGNIYFIPGGHLVFINLWRERVLGVFKNLKLDHNTVS